MLRGIIFDKDGTLFDFRRSWSGWTHDMLIDLSGGSPDLARSLGRRIGYDIDTLEFSRDSLVIAGTVAEVAGALSGALPEIGRRALEDRLSAAAAGARMVPAVPLAPLMEALRAMGLSLGVATNDAEQAARKHLQVAGIIDSFEYVAGYDSGHGAKPDPAICRAVAAALGCPAEACVMVGDSTHDLLAGRAAGMVTVGVLTGPAPAADLARLADAVLDDIGALPGWLAARM